ncbi:unnamed protein product, partial [Musa acuminata subsp. burmannicoides]
MHEASAISDHNKLTSLQSSLVLHPLYERLELPVQLIYVLVLRLILINPLRVHSLHRNQFKRCITSRFSLLFHLAPFGFGAACHRRLLLHRARFSCSRFRLGVATIKSELFVVGFLVGVVGGGGEEAEQAGVPGDEQEEGVAEEEHGLPADEVVEVMEKGRGELDGKETDVAGVAIREDQEEDGDGEEESDEGVIDGSSAPRLLRCVHHTVS